MLHLIFVSIFAAVHELFLIYICVLDFGGVFKVASLEELFEVELVGSGHLWSPAHVVTIGSEKGILVYDSCVLCTPYVLVRVHILQFGRLHLRFSGIARHEIVKIVITFLLDALDRLLTLITILHIAGFK